jgi:hypothetical protein
MKKLNEQQIKEIKESKEGLLATARKYRVNPNTIKYYRSEEYRNYLREYQKIRYKNMTKEQKEEYMTKKREYQKKYHKERYTNDPKFRNKQIERVKEYQKKKYRS